MRRQTPTEAQRQAKQAEKDRKQITEAIENFEILRGLFTDLLHFCHRDDEERTEANWLDQGDYIRDRNQVKGLEQAQIHIGRCETCRKRLKHLLESLNIKPSPG